MILPQSYSTYPYIKLSLHPISTTQNPHQLALSWVLRLGLLSPVRLFFLSHSTPPIIAPNPLSHPLSHHLPFSIYLLPDFCLLIINWLIIHFNFLLISQPIRVCFLDYFFWRLFLIIVYLILVLRARTTSLTPQPSIPSYPRQPIIHSLTLTFYFHFSNLDHHHLPAIPHPLPPPPESNSDQQIAYSLLLRSRIWCKREQ